MLCTNIVLNVKTKKNNFCRQHVLDMYFSVNSMNNLLSYCGLTYARMRPSENDLPVLKIYVLSNSKNSVTIVVTPGWCVCNAMECSLK